MPRPLFFYCTLSIVAHTSRNEMMRKMIAMMLVVTFAGCVSHPTATITIEQQPPYDRGPVVKATVTFKPVLYPNGYHPQQFTKE